MRLYKLHYTRPTGWSAPLPAWDDSDRTLVLVFGASRWATDAQPLIELGRALPLAVRLGCSTAGEILDDAVHDDSVCAVVARFEHTRLHRACVDVAVAGDSRAAGFALASELTQAATPAQGPLRAVFALSDGLGVSGSELVAGLQAGLPLGCALSGGMAGDGDRFGQTWTLDGMGVARGRVCAVGLYGHRLRVGHGCEAGWSGFGPERHISRAQGNVLYELDGQPALALYKRYLGERAQGLPGTALLFPLLVQREAGDAHALVRTVLGVDEATQSMTFAGDLPAGGVARLMRASSDHLVDSAGAAAEAALAALTGVPADAPTLMVSVSCVGRRLVLGERTDDEVETVAEAVGQRGAHVGFYSYGEIAPTARGCASELHNQTMTVTAMAES